MSRVSMARKKRKSRKKKGGGFGFKLGKTMIGVGWTRTGKRKRRKK
jgi:hypothetical protein